MAGGRRRRSANSPDTGAVLLDDTGKEFAGTSLEGAGVSIFTSFKDCEGRWRAALEHCAAFAFQGFEWQSTWQATIGQAERVSPAIVHVADRDGRTLLLLPLGIYPEHKLRVLRFLGGVITDYNVPLIDRSFAKRITKSEFARLWEIIVALLPSVDVIWLRRMPETIEDEANPVTGLRGAAHTENAYGAHLPATFDAFKAARRAKLFNDSRRQRKRLAEIGPVTISTPVAVEAAIPTLRVMARQKSRRWLESGGRDLFVQPGYLAFYERLTECAFQTGFVHVSSLQVGDEIVATHWGVVFGRRFYYLMPGYEAADWARYSAGRLLLESLVEWCIAQDLSVFDLTVGDDSYKLQWADHSVRLYEFLAPRSAKGMLFVTYRRLRERLRQSTEVRRFVRWARVGIKRIAYRGSTPLGPG
jgi:CelD/BcsL family acetyltransferase involved in cellulose biosynthesis